jgi:hypothetical protein
MLSLLTVAFPAFGPTASRQYIRWTGRYVPVVARIDR